MDLFISDNDVLYGFQKKIISQHARAFIYTGSYKHALSVAVIYALRSAGCFVKIFLEKLKDQHYFHFLCMYKYYEVKQKLDRS